MLGEILNYFHLSFIGNITKFMVHENGVWKIIEKQFLNILVA